MSKKISRKNMSQTTLKVISQTKESVRVLFPTLEVPVEMTNKYFNYLQNTGAYIMMYCVTTVG